MDKKVKFVINKHGGVRIDLMILQKFWPKVVSLIQQTSCVYYKEDWVELPGNDYVIIRDVKSGKNGWGLGELISMIYGLEHDSEIEANDKGPVKFYILIKPRKKGKKHVQKNREEAGTGSESGSGVGSGSDVPGEDPGIGGSGNQPFVVGPDDICELKKFSPVSEDSDNDNDH